MFRGIPHPALAAIVIAAMLHLSKPGYLRDLFSRSRDEFAVAAIVIAGKLALGVLKGIVAGVVLALLKLKAASAAGWPPAKHILLDAVSAAPSRQ